MKQRPNSNYPHLNQIKKAAIEASHLGGKVLLRHFQKKLKVSEKKGAGLVTNADLESEEKTVKYLRKAVPEFGFLTEESPPQDLEKPGKWLIDPLDGTTNFVHGFPMFCVSIAAEWNGEIVAGVIYHPVLDETYVAILGGGATLNGKPIGVSKTSKLSQALLSTGFTYKKDQWLQAEMELFESLSANARAIRRPGAAALDLAYTARGVFDAFWERNLSPWDVAAGILLVQEAGGKVTNFQGKKSKSDDGQILASNSALHPLLLKQVSAAAAQHS